MIFYITFHVFYCSTMLLHSLFRMGQSDYLYDNLNAEAILRKRKIYIYIFILLAHIANYRGKKEIIKLFVWNNCFWLTHAPAHTHTHNDLLVYVCAGVCTWLIVRLSQCFVCLWFIIRSPLHESRSSSRKDLIFKKQKTTVYYLSISHFHEYYTPPVCLDQVDWTLYRLYSL